MMAYGWETVKDRIALTRSGRAPFRDMAHRHPYWAAAVRAAQTGAMAAVDGRFRPDDPVTPVELAQVCATRLGRTPELGRWPAITHGAFFLLAEGLLGRQG